jgi:hypothetical protein
VNPFIADTSPNIGALDIDFDHHGLFNTLVADLAELLESIAGVEDACAYVSGIAARLGTDIEKQYKVALGVQHLSRDQLIEVLIDLKNRAGGAFSVIERDEDRVVFSNCSCPLGRAAGEPSFTLHGDIEHLRAPERQRGRVRRSRPGGDDRQGARPNAAWFCI